MFTTTFILSFFKTKEYGYKNNKQRCDTELFNDCI